MKILLDENLPGKLKITLKHSHKVLTVQEMGWHGKKNGELLGLMTMHDFDALVTIDKNLVYQQNVAKFPLTIFILNAPNNKIETLQPYVNTLNEVITKSSKSGVVEINI